MFLTLCLAVMTASIQPVDMDFIKACQAGFKADFGSSETAKELGWGTCEILESGRKREGEWKCEEGVPRPEQYYSIKEMVEKQSGHDATDTPKHPATWYAWRTEKGELCIAFNVLFGDFEQSVVWQVTEGEHEWMAWNTYSITSPPHKTRWTKADKVKFGWLKLGPVEPTAKALRQKLDQLVQLKVITSFSFPKKKPTPKGKRTPSH